MHFYVERKSTRLKRQELLNEVFNDDEKLEMEWESADSWNTVGDGGVVKILDRSERFYSGRNYTLFGILAGVRTIPKNGPISKPKGFPNDASDDIKSEYEAWYGDSHSTSNFTLKELKEVDWSKYSENSQQLVSFMETIEKMEKLDSNPENVRCIFWFDN
jgi:hypothetical protein